MQGTFLVSIYVGILFILFYTPFVFTKGIIKMDYGVLRKSDYIKSAIPVYNISLAESIFFGNKVSSLAITSSISIVSIVARFVAIFYFYESEMAQIVTVIIMVVAIIALYINNAIIMFRIMYISDVISIPKCIVFAILFPIGQVYVGTYISNLIKNTKKSKEVFK